MNGRLTLIAPPPGRRRTLPANAPTPHQRPSYFPFQLVFRRQGHSRLPYTVRISERALIDFLVNTKKNRLHYCTGLRLVAGFSLCGGGGGNGRGKQPEKSTFPVPLEQLKEGGGAVGKFPFFVSVKRGPFLQYFRVIAQQCGPGKSGRPRLLLSARKCERQPRCFVQVKATLSPISG